MGKVVLFAAVSLDGYVGRDDDMPGPLFDWYGNGDVDLTFSDPDRPFRVTAETAGHMREFAARVGVMVCGRHLFDITDGWEGVPPNGEHVVVVTHRPVVDWPHAGRAPFTFVPDVPSGIERARELAGERDVTVSAGDVGGQALRAGLVDQVALALVPVVLGSGKPFSGSGGAPEVLLEDPVTVVQGERGAAPGLRRPPRTGKAGRGVAVAGSAPLRTRRAERGIMWPPPDPLETV